MPVKIGKNWLWPVRTAKNLLELLRTCNNWHGEVRTAKNCQETLIISGTTARVSFAIVHDVCLVRHYRVSLTFVT